jgi:hypothetical protein
VVQRNNYSKKKPSENSD